MKKLALRLFTILTIGIMLSLLIVFNRVAAANSTYGMVGQQPSLTLNQLKDNILIDTDEKIMKYDARTNETTVVDMDELKELINPKISYLSSNSNSSSSSNAIIIPPYNLPDNSNTTPDVSPMGYLPNSAEMVSNTNNYPNNQICRLEFQDSNNITHYGSAALIGGPRVAITAAHCVFNVNDNKATYKNWKIQPGYSNGSTTGTVTGWDQVYYSSNWMNSSGNNMMYDWAICVLQADTTGSALGAIANVSDSDLNNLRVTVYGYPADSNYRISSFSKISI